MAKHYFRNVPDFDYVSRVDGQKNVSDYVTVKNLFKRVKIREEIFDDLTYFTKYKVVGDDRPDNVAHKVYGDPRYDWVVLLSNNIINVETEWPKDQESFHNYLMRKYGSDENLQGIHHYETIEIKDSLGRTIVRPGLQVPLNYVTSYYDSTLQTQVSTVKNKISFTNYAYEEALEDDKRNIFLVRPEFLSLIKNDLDDIMPYPEGSSQYVSDNLVRGDNIRLYT